MRRALRPVAGALGHDLVARDCYSPIVRVGDLPPEVWERRSPLHGIAFDAAAQLAWAQRELGPYIAEFAREAPPGWNPANGMYDSGDAEILYAIIRHRRPRRIVELGAGQSSRVIAAACRVNAARGARPHYDVFEPSPRRALLRELHEYGALHTTRAQDVPFEVFTGLGDGDLLFVDTTHTVKLDGDVNRIVLDVLPVLAPGVLVHFHDVFLPGEVHRAWIENGWHWTEAYLLQAFLAMNPGYAVRYGAHAVWLDHRAELRELVPQLGAAMPSGFWIERLH